MEKKLIMPFKFELTAKEEKKFKKWKKKLPKIKQNNFGTVDGNYWFKFIPTGIGDVVYVGRSDIPELDENITDYDSW
jgi:hypothetical protein